MPKPMENFVFEAKVKRVTDKAVEVICETHGIGEPFWIPKSQIIDPDPEDLAKGDEEEIEIPMWLAEEKCLV